MLSRISGPLLLGAFSGLLLVTGCGKEQKAENDANSKEVTVHVPGMT
jgi:hypothetical protein